MKNQLCTRQVCFIMYAYPAAGKILMMPALLAYYCKNDLAFTALFIFILQTAAVCALAAACARSEKTFFQLVEGAFGKVVSKIFMWLFAAFFVLSAFVPMLEQKLFVQAIFYDTIPSLITFLPFFALAVYVGAKGMRNAARTADIAAPLFIGALVALVIMSVGESNLVWLLPVLKTPASDIFSGARFAMYNFTDGAVMLMLMGRFRAARGDVKKIVLSYAASALTVLIFLVLFYSIFSVLAPDQYFAVSKMAIFFSVLSLVGSVDLIAVYAMEACMLFGLLLYLQIAVTCVCEAIGSEQTAGRKVRPAAAAASVAINAILLALVIIFNEGYAAVQKVYGNYLWPIFLAFSFIIPAIGAVLAFISSRGEKGGRRGEKGKKAAGGEL